MNRDKRSDGDDATVSLAAGRQAAEQRKPPADPATRMAGTRIGRFELRALLGAGGMGAVYRAVDVMLERDVALKLLHSDDGAPEQSARLLREAKAMAKLSHPNLVTVYDAGVADGQFFIAMELVEGTTLRTWHGTTNPSADDLLDAFIAAGQGLQAAHDTGLVHRDFKPANVLVRSDGLVQVADFGIATTPAAPAASAASAGEDTQAPRPVAAGGLTRTGAFMGTPRYMSPEQHLCEPVDARSDQFSFAVALAEALNGEPPFSGNQYSVIADRVLNGEPHLRNRETAIGAVLARALARDPSKRYASMTAMLAALEDARRVRQRRTPWFIALGLAGAAAVAVAAWITLSGGGGAAAPSPATAPQPVATAPHAATTAPPSPTTAPPSPTSAPPRRTTNPTAALAAAAPDASPPSRPAPAATGRISTTRPAQRKPITSGSSKRVPRQTRPPPTSTKQRRNVPPGWGPYPSNAPQISCKRTPTAKYCNYCCGNNGPFVKMLPYPDCGCYFNYTGYRRKHYLEKPTKWWRPTGRTCKSVTGVKRAGRAPQKVCRSCCNPLRGEKTMAYPDCRCFKKLSDKHILEP